jgi:hypothetical protein
MLDRHTNRQVDLPDERRADTDMIETLEMQNSVASKKFYSCLTPFLSRSLIVNTMLPTH